MTASPLLFAILPNTVKPPFCLSRFAPLAARLKNHWLVALLGSVPSFAMAMVPRALVTLNSFFTAAAWVAATGVWFCS